ncbi:MAG: hypothetical protein RBU45_14445 [Myxococcota bacterium]|nr:hypothetical protein [Myxococcota bacterium]
MNEQGNRGGTTTHDGVRMHETPQQRITEQTRRWARHEGVGDVGTTSSFANMEALLKREYFGRFVIELIQNARDAWYANRSARSERSVVRILLHGSPPVLTVSNQGVALDASGLIKHIAQFGESSKKAGAGIGHKGIGFKSVLEITRCPEILSRADHAGPFDLRVRFDPRFTERTIDACSYPRTWAELVAECDPGGLRNKDERLPILRFPHWLESTPHLVEAEAVLDGVPFNTLVRLPYDAAFDTRLGLNPAEWLTRVREAMAGLSDEIVMLLDAFDRVVVEDRLMGEHLEIRVASRELRTLAAVGGGSVRQVAITRNGHASSSWLLYERSLAKLGGDTLAGELVVGIPVEEHAGRLVPVLPPEEARCFHLFFPTQIATHLPFLLHAYFEVDAGRTRFAPDAVARNEELLAALQDLVIDAVSDLVAADDVEAVGLPALFGRTMGQPEDPLAARFVEQLLDRLDETPWICAVGHDRPVAPRQLLISERIDLAAHLPVAFPPAYASRRAGLYHPAWVVGAEGDEDARAFLAGRPCCPPLLGEGGVLGKLLRPGEESQELDCGQADARFRALMAVLDQAAVNDREGFRAVAASLRGDPEARFIPVVGPEDPTGQSSRMFVSPPAEFGASSAVFARLSAPGSLQTTVPGEATGAEIGVPACLDMAFLPPDTLTPELLSGPAAALGIRPFGTDAVLDQLPCRPWSPTEGASVLRFMWRLLLRESVSRFGVKAALDSRQRFEPGRYFWCEPTWVQDPEQRRDLTRRKVLASIPLPTRSGDWRPAGEMLFGRDWADPGSVNVDDHLVADALGQRLTAYEDLELLTDDAADFVASPDTLAGQLGLVPEDVHWLRDEVLATLRLPGDHRTIDGMPSDVRQRLHRDLLHAFLLGLGVWEVPPVDAAVNDLRAEASDFDPFDGTRPPGQEQVLRYLRKNRKEWFGVSYSHANVRIAADYRLRRDLATPACSPERELALARALTRGAALYGKLLRARLFCDRCGNHHHRHWSRFDGSGNSTLWWQLTHAPWVPVMIDGQATGPRIPAESWWMKDPPHDLARIAVNPRRFLPLVRPGIGSELLRLVGGHLLEEASPDELEGLLQELRDQFKGDCLPISLETASARQAFVGLHRLLYTQLARASVPERAREILDRVLVLAHRGPSLEFGPRRTVLYSDGSHGAFKRHFVGRVLFAPLNVGEDDVARALGLPFFEVTCTMGTVGSTESQTEPVADFLEERLAEIMSLLTHLPLGGRPLDVDGEQFRLRSQRLLALEVVRVDDVVLSLSVDAGEGTITTPIGSGPDHDIFLDWQPRRAPVLYHDFQGPLWFDPLRRRLGEVVAQLVENPAFRDTCSLFLQVDGDAREAFLDERGITPAAVDEVCRALGRAGLLARQLSQIWWTVLLDQVGADGTGLPAEQLEAEVLRRLEHCSWADEPERCALVALGGGAEVRSDVRPEGALALLERRSLDLSRLHAALLARGDQGLRIGVADELLRRWRAEHGDKVAFALTCLGMGLEEARKRVRSWRVPEALQFRVRVRLAEALTTVLADLRAAGLLLADDALEPACIDAVLACACDLPLAEWHMAWRQVYGPEEHERLLHLRALAWRDAAEVFAVALMTTPGELPYRIRAARNSYRDLVPGSVARPTEVREALTTAFDERGLGERATGFLAQLPQADVLEAPDRDALAASLPPELQLHVEEVRAALAKRKQERLDAIRRSMAELAAAGVKPRPLPYAPERTNWGGEAGAGRQGPLAGCCAPGSATRKRVAVGKVPKRDLDKLGERGEAWALAAVVRPLEALLEDNHGAFEEAILALRQLLTCHWEGKAVEALLPHAERALDGSLSADERLDELAAFLHLSAMSDGFGCDMLGWLPPHEGAAARALALEVKASTARSFLVSDHEWEVAAQVAAEYAFLVVRRSGGKVIAMDLLPDPRALPDHAIRCDPDTWRVAYSAQEGRPQGTASAEAQRMDELPAAPPS